MRLVLQLFTENAFKFSLGKSQMIIYDIVYYHFMKGVYYA